MIAGVNQRDIEVNRDQDILSSRIPEGGKKSRSSHSRKSGRGSTSDIIPASSSVTCSALSSLLNMANVDAISSLIHSPRDLKRGTAGLLSSQDWLSSSSSRGGKGGMFSCPEPLNLSASPSLTIGHQQYHQQQQLHQHQHLHVTASGTVEDPFGPQAIKSRSTPSSASSASSTLSPSSSSGQVSGSSEQHHHHHSLSLPHPPPLSSPSSASLQVERENRGMNRLNTTRLSPLASLLISDLVSVATSGNFVPSNNSAASSSLSATSASSCPASVQDTSPCLVNNGNSRNNKKKDKNNSAASATTTKSLTTFRGKNGSTSKKLRQEKYQSAALDLSSKKRRDSEEEEDNESSITNSRSCNTIPAGTGTKKSGRSALDKHKLCDPFEYLVGGKSGGNEKDKPHGLLLRLFPDSFLSKRIANNNNSNDEHSSTQTSNRAKNELNGKDRYSLHTFLCSQHSVLCSIRSIYMVLYSLPYLPTFLPPAS